MAVELAVFLRRIVALVEGFDAEIGDVTLESPELAENGRGISVALGAEDFQLGIEQRQPCQPHAAQQGRIGGDGSFGPVEKLVVALPAGGVEHAVFVRNGRIINPERSAGSEQGPFQEFFVLIETGCGGAVIPVHETLHERIGVLRGVPHELGDDVGTQLGEVAAVGTADLREVHPGAVTPEKADVGGEHGEVGERLDHVVEVDAVVPDEKVVGQRGPTLQRGDELAARGGFGEGRFAVAADAAQHDVDVREGPRMAGRLHGEKVGQRGKPLVGKTLGQLVQKPDVIARGSPLLDVDPLARFAAAVGAVAVVLTDGNPAPAGIGAENRVDACGDGLEQRGIRQTPLAGAPGAPLAVDERIVFGVLGTVAFGGQKTVESMDPQIAREDVGGLFEPQEKAVDRILRHAVSLALTIAERGIVGRVEPGQDDVGAPVEGVDAGGEVVHAQIALQERDDAVDGTAAAAARNAQRAVGPGPQAEAVVGKPQRVGSA